MLVELALCPRCGASLTERQSVERPQLRGELLSFQVECDSCDLSGRIQLPLREYRRRQAAVGVEWKDRREQGRLVAHFRNTLEGVTTIEDIVEWV